MIPLCFLPIPLCAGQNQAESTVTRLLRDKRGLQKAADTLRRKMTEIRAENRRGAGEPEFYFPRVWVPILWELMPCFRPHAAGQLQADIASLVSILQNMSNRLTSLQGATGAAKRPLSAFVSIDDLLQAAHYLVRFVLLRWSDATAWLLHTI